MGAEVTCTLQNVAFLFFIYTLARAFQVFYFEKMEVNDFRNDVLLAEACRSDVDAYCKHVEPGAPFLLYFLLRFCDGQVQLWMKCHVPTMLPEEGKPKNSYKWWLKVACKRAPSPIQ